MRTPLPTRSSLPRGWSVLRQEPAPVGLHKCPLVSRKTQDLTEVLDEHFTIVSLFLSPVLLAGVGGKLGVY